MSDALDSLTLGLVSELIHSDQRAAKVVQRLWRERALAVDGLQKIRDWDLMHAEVRTLAIVDQVVAETLQEVGEE